METQMTQEMYLKWGYIVALCIVFVSVYRDIRQHRINIYLLIAGSLFAVFIRVLADVPLKEGIVGCIPGILFLICGYMTHHAIGYGDGWMFMIIGMCLGIRESVLVLSICLIFIAIYGLFMMVVRKKARKTAVAVMPWLFFSLLIGCLM